ncbi:MAG: GNAT family N-acetyltransferase [Anaerolineae bacterium]|nr:GNAT family N-acetyltransferase [Anaerolineae bacterium]
MERRGMRLEGRLRENRWFKGRWWDTLIYGILDREWEAQETGR